MRKSRIRTLKMILISSLGLMILSGCSNSASSQSQSVKYLRSFNGETKIGDNLEINGFDYPDKVTFLKNGSGIRYKSVNQNTLDVMDTHTETTGYYLTLSRSEYAKAYKKYSTIAAPVKPLKKLKFKEVVLFVPKKNMNYKTLSRLPKASQNDGQYTAFVITKNKNTGSVKLTDISSNNIQLPTEFNKD